MATYKIEARLASNGNWIHLKGQDIKAGKIKKRFLWWTWEKVKMKWDLTTQTKALDLARSFMKNPEYQDVKIIEHIGLDGEWEWIMIWSNGMWV